MTRAKRLPSRGIDPAEHGYERIEGDFENGLHPGMNDKPRDIYARLKERYARIVFVVDSVGQFNVQFSAWRKVPPYEVIVGNIGEVCSTNDEAEARRTFREYVRQSERDYGARGWGERDHHARWRNCPRVYRETE